MMAHKLEVGLLEQTLAELIKRHGAEAVIEKAKEIAGLTGVMTWAGESVEALEPVAPEPSKVIVIVM
jgi:hypothetical protein